MLVLYCINSVKHEIFWLSKKLGITYHLKQRDYYASLKEVKVRQDSSRNTTTTNVDKTGCCIQTPTAPSNHHRTTVAPWQWHPPHYYPPSVFAPHIGYTILPVHRRCCLYCLQQCPVLNRLKHLFLLDRHLVCILHVQEQRYRPNSDTPDTFSWWRVSWPSDSGLLAPFGVPKIQRHPVVCMVTASGHWTESDTIQ